MVQAAGSKRALAALARGGLIALLFCAAVLVRMLPVKLVLLADRVQLFGHDAYYHMRRILHTLKHFPTTLDFDLYINFPDGARAIWTPVFDWSTALLLWPGAGRVSMRALEMGASFVPPLLGGLTVVAVAVLGRRPFGGPVALLAAATLVVLPGHFWYSQYGYIDHHCAIALVGTLLLFASMQQLDTLCESGTAGRLPLPGAALVGGLLALALLVWPGMLLQVGIIESALLVVLLSRPGAAEAARVAGWIGVMHAVAFCVIAPLSLGQTWGQWSDMSPVVLSSFQPWLFGSAALFGLLCSSAWRRWPLLGRSLPWRATTTGVPALAIALVSLAVWPSLIEGAVEAWAWLTRTDSFQSLVGESAPLFWTHGEPDVFTAATNLSWFALLVPIALLSAAALARGAPHPASLRLLLWWTLVICGVTVLQRRFSNSASVAIALLLALTLWEIWRWGARRISRRSLRGLFAAVLGLFHLGLLYPCLLFYTPLLADHLRGDDRVLLSGRHLDRYAMGETALWLRRNTPETSGWLDPGSQPQYGVVAPWDMGHIIEYVGRRPTSSTNFGDDIGAENFLLVQSYYSGPATGASEILDRLQGRYVVAPHYDDFLARTPDRSSVYRALRDRDGSELVSADGTGRVEVPALERHRLVFEYTGESNDPSRHGLFKVFEHVTGASIVGRASPGAEIRLRLDADTAGYRHFSYETRTVARDDGRYALRVPYANPEEAGAGAPGAVTPATHYVLECGDASGQVRVRERDVRRGHRLRGPDLCIDVGRE